MRILVTNDDGISSPATVSLVAALRGTGADVIAALPDQDASGCGTWLGRYPNVPIAARHIAAECDTWAVAGTPGFIVSAACLGAFGSPPDVVVAGVNHGANTGRHILYSGTVGAALVAAKFGVPAVAVSQLRGTPWEVDSASRIAADTVGLARAAWLGPVLSINVPNLSLADIKGVRAAALAPFRSMTMGAGGAIIRRPLPPLPSDCDEALLAQNFVTVTRLDGYRSHPVAPALIIGLAERLLQGRV